MGLNTRPKLRIRFSKRSLSRATWSQLPFRACRYANSHARITWTSGLRLKRTFLSSKPESSCIGSLSISLSDVSDAVSSSSLSVSSLQSSAKMTKLSSLSSDNLRRRSQGLNLVIRSQTDVLSGVPLGLSEQKTMKLSSLSHSDGDFLACWRLRGEKGMSIRSTAGRFFTNEHGEILRGSDDGIEAIKSHT
uniref:Uncharacterized protein n=1 Tax=Lutzomyia longipalpis TaxID=7200 RepID=A0A7G3B5T1_LUTLO